MIVRGIEMKSRWVRAALVNVVMFLGCVLGCNQEADLERGKRLLAEGRSPAALEAFRDALAADPDDPERNHVYGALLLATGQPSSAVFSLEKAARSEQFRVASGLLLAKAQLQTGTGIDAIRATTRVLEIEPDNVDALAFRAKAYLVEQREEDALEDIEHGLDLEPDRIQLSVMKIEALLNLQYLEEVKEGIAELRAKIEAMDPPNPALAAQYCGVQASFLFEQGLADEAATTIEGCIEAQPTDLQVISMAVEIYDSEKQPDRSDEVILRASELAPDNLQLRVLRATRLTASGKPDEAVALLRGATKRQSTAWLALLDLANDLDDPKLALEAIEGAIESTGNASPELSLARADVLIRLGDPRAEAAVAALESSVYRDAARGRLLLGRQQPGKALEALSASIRLWPDNPMTRYLAGHAAEQLGDFDRAATEYREATRLDPAHTEAGYHLAQILEARGEYSAANHALARYMESRPHDMVGLAATLRIAVRQNNQPMIDAALKRLAAGPGGPGLAMSILANHMLDLGGPEAAIHAVRTSKIDPVDPANVETLAVFAEALWNAEEKDEARALVEESLERGSRDANLLAVRGRLGLLAGDLDRAELDFNQSLQTEPNLVVAIAGIAELNEKMGAFEEALAGFERAARLRSDDTQYVVGAARVEARLGRGEAARARLDSLLQSRPRDVPAARALAGLLLESGSDTKRAVQMARRAVTFGKTSLDLELLGRALQAAGHEAQAQDAFRRAEHLAPAGV